MIIVFIGFGVVFFFLLLCLFLFGKKHTKSKLPRESFVVQQKVKPSVKNGVVSPDNDQLGKVLEFTAYLRKHNISVRAEDMPTIILPLSKCSVDQRNTVGVLPVDDECFRNGAILSVYDVNIRSV